MIDKNIPLPGINADIKRYYLDLDRLKVGDSIFVNCSRTLINRAIKQARSLPSWKFWFFESARHRDFKTRAWKQGDDKGIRVWRVI